MAEAVDAVWCLPRACGRSGLTPIEAQSDEDLLGVLVAPEADLEAPESDFEEPESDFEEPESDFEEPESDFEEPESELEEAEELAPSLAPLSLDSDLLDSLYSCASRERFLVP
jgi:hypothetical protein